MLKNPSLYNPEESEEHKTGKCFLSQNDKYGKIKNRMDSFKTSINLDCQKVDHNEGLAPILENNCVKMKSGVQKTKNQMESIIIYTDGLIIHQ